ncbi:MAG: DNA repair protein RadC [Candidatus Pedobacter colombiensis]|uniref:DNA repair protein RadC n=1 Tax=Candidatus Pedobacter colombiensis TaxID=3121371 RepID=A0AAJ5W471_9SPHI|nr:DNA repair protein RadC [Pedobacter sp.]WEK17841.1 MAG: DNA repair protein RadC [Pedobacter sp.]
MYNKKLTIKDWSFQDRPREKLLIQGKKMMSDAELLAILIGSGSRDETAVELSRRILHCMDNDIQKLAELSIHELLKFKGIGEAKAIAIIAALEFSYRRINKEATRQTIKIQESKDIYKHMTQYLKNLNGEEFWAVILNRENRIICTHQLNKQSETNLDAKLLFELALENQAQRIILCRYDPFGTLKPSNEDLLINKLVEAGKMLGVCVCDYLILTDMNYLSFTDQGLL